MLKTSDNHVTIINIYVNKSTNIISLSIDEFENLVYILENIDIFNASQLLINYYMMYLVNSEKLKEAATGKEYNKNVKSIDWLSSNNTSKTVSNYRPEEKDDIFDGLE